MSTITNLDEKRLENIFERVVKRVLRREFDISVTKELQWLQDGEEAVKGKRYKKPKPMISDLLR